MAQSALPEPLYAVAGAGDLIAERVRELAARAPGGIRQLRDDLPRLRADLPRDLSALAADLPSYAAQLQSRAKQVELDDVATAVRRNVDAATGQAQQVYAGLVKRGRTVVNGSAPRPAPKPENATVATTTAKTTAARTTAKKVATKAAKRPGKEA